MLVTKGDITDETSDIILSITDDSFSLSRGKTLITIHTLTVVYLLSATILL